MEDCFGKPSSTLILQHSGGNNPRDPKKESMLEDSQGDPAISVQAFRTMQEITHQELCKDQHFPNTSSIQRFRITSWPTECRQAWKMGSQEHLFATNGGHIFVLTWFRKPCLKYSKLRGLDDCSQAPSWH
jgi:hypothetical protein